MEKIYIRSASAISPQHTFGDVPFLEQAVIYETSRLKVIEPDYKEFIDPKLIRRMSKVIKMGVSAAKDCLNRAGVEMPDAIITGTAYGCVEDTGVFLTRIIEQEEEMLPPTAFIQSTHNTVAAQIALMLKCHAYNNTFVHKSFSFESALLDASMLFAEGEANTILVGGVDEVTDISFAVFNRFGIYKKGPFKNTSLFEGKSKATISGEGTAFFMLSNQPSAVDIACLSALGTFYKPIDAEEEIAGFLNDNGIDLGNIDLVISGKNGHDETDAVLEKLEEGIFKNNSVVNYKHLCGEYPVASSFALWLATNIIKKGIVPKTIGHFDGEVKKILICNQYQNKYWSLMLVEQC